jgi:hypothetical protein
MNNKKLFISRMEDYVEFAEATKRFSDAGFYRECIAEMDRLQAQVAELSQAIDLALTDCHVGGNVTPCTLNMFETVMKKARSGV